MERNLGKFYTKDHLSQKLALIIKNYVNPSFILEPFVGNGSLIKPFGDNIAGTLNDINKEAVKSLNEQFKKGNWNIKNVDFIETETEEIVKNWKIPQNCEKFLIYSNPPFGTSSRNQSISSKEEKILMKKENVESRKIRIRYGGLEKKYGRGDLVLPAIGKMIEVIKKFGRGYLGFFSPLGVFCGRIRYRKLLNALLHDFLFLYGKIFTGRYFENINKDKSIVFCLLKYYPNCRTLHESISLEYNGSEIRFKKMDLLKDGWFYDNRKIIKREIAIQGNERFNIPYGKSFKSNVKSGGSEIVPENVKIPLDLPPKVPSELTYGLWSSFLGYHSFITHPVYMSEAYVHLPDFKRQETREILAYLILYNIITETINKKTNGKIGFEGDNRLFSFGGQTLTMGAKYLLEKYKDCPLGNSTIQEVFYDLKNIKNINRLKEDYRKYIKSEINKRLVSINYWKYIPIPNN